MITRKLFQLAPDDLGNGTAHPGVDLVQDHRCDTARLRFEAFQREHHARQLATRSDSREWHRRLAKVWREIELDCVETGGSKRKSITHEGRIVRTNFAKARLENGASHSKCLELGLHPALEFGSVALAPRVQLLRSFEQRIERLSELALRLGAAFGDRFEFDDFLARAFSRLDRRFERAAAPASEAAYVFDTEPPTLTSLLAAL